MYNSEEVNKTLKEVVSILERNKVDYRFLGSVVTAAIFGNLHRRLGDLDLLVDEEKKEVVRKELEKLGFKRAGGMFAFARKYMSLETLIHDELLSVGYFLGRFNNDGSFRMGNTFINVSIKGRSAKPTNYELNGTAFVGIPKSAVAVGIIQSKSNPKRKKEVAMLQRKKIKPFKDEGVVIHIFGVRVNWIYKASMILLNLLGNLRVRLGVPFDPWRSKIR